MNSNINHILSLISSLREQGFSLWLESEKLKVQGTRGQALSEKEKSEIGSGKELILKLLEANQIFSKESFDKKVILSLASFNLERALSFSQSRLWFIEQFSEGTHAYNCPLLIQLSDDVDLDFLTASFQSVIKRHQVLRTKFYTDQEGRDYQIVDHSDLEIKIVSIEEALLDQELNKEINRHFNLRAERPVFIRIYKTPSKTMALINVHHIAFDGWSMGVFIKELEAFYRNHSQGGKLGLSDLEIEYTDFSLWQRAYLQGPVLDKQIEYWTSHLSGYESLNFPLDKKRPKEISYQGENFRINFSPDLSKKLRALAKEKRTTLYTLMLSGFYILLSKYTGQSDLILGIPISNRHHRQLGDLIGFFANTLTLRAQIKPNFSFADLLDQVNQDVIGAQSHQDLPFERLIDLLEVEKDPSRHPLFQMMFGVQSFSENISNELFESLPIDAYYKVAKFDLSFFIDDGKEVLTGLLAYATALFNHETIERLARHYAYVLEQIVANPNILISKISAVLPSEQHLLLNTWNKRNTIYSDSQRSFCALFEDQVRKDPHRIAVVFEGQTLTYQALNQRANQVARLIRKTYENKTGSSLKANTLIGVCTERSLESLIGILGVLKAGGAYVPIDPAYPEERLNFILEDSKTALVLSSGLSEIVSPLAGETGPEDVSLTGQRGGPVWISIDQENLYSHESSENLELPSSSQDIAYVIYTSGTTGQPKGTLISQGSLANLMFNQKEFLELQEDQVILQFASLSFDAAVWECFSSLIYGLKIIIASDSDRRDASVLLKTLKDEKVNLVTLPPAMLSQMDYVDLPDLKILVIAGDTCPTEVMDQWSQNRKLINAYGPTESTVCATYHVYHSGDSNTNIGKPLNNIRVYVLDHDLNPVPVGVIGNLYLGGSGLAQGYLNREELTQERFIPNPLASQSDQEKGYTRLYKTGDLVKWLPDGNLDYIGRNDFQVKIRGFRIELGEIEKALLSHDLIKQAAVVVKTRAATADKYLAAYYVSESPIETSELSNFLARLLPDYMAPGVFVYLDSLPLTINGKLDQKALPEPEIKSDQESYLAPRNSIEEKICEIWSEVLGISLIGVQDDFFNLGGDSILSIRLTSKLQQAGFPILVKTIFECRTVENLVKYLERHSDSVHAPLEVMKEVGVLTGEFDLLPIQTWFFENNFKVPNHWNQAFLAKVPDLEINQLNHWIAELTQRHDALRLAYKKDSESVWKQSYQEFDELNIPKVKTLDRSKLSDFELEKILTEWQRDFDITQGPLWCVGYITGYPDQTARLFFAFHHLMIDIFSWRILIEDLNACYQGKAISQKTTSYRQWVSAVNQYAEANQDELSFWESQIKNQVDYLSYFEKSEKSQSTKISLSAAQTTRLLQKVNLAYHTEINDVLLSALAYAIYECTGLEKSSITLEGHGREAINDQLDLSQIMGWFTTTYPIALGVEETPSKTLKNIKENLRSIPNKGLGYGALKYAKNLENNLLAQHRLPGISFNYFGQFESSKDLWSVVDEASGVSVHEANQTDFILALNGWVIDESLSFNLEGKITESDLNKIAQAFIKNLERIIDHCGEIADQGLNIFTPSDFKEVELSTDYLERFQSQYEIEAIYPANSLQEGFIYHALSQPEDDAYVVQFIYEYSHEIKIDLFKQAWDQVIKIYPILRACFSWEETPIQIICKSGKLDWHEHDFSGLSELEKNQKIAELQRSDRDFGFDLSKPTLQRIHLVKLSKSAYILLLSQHHSILDGWSGGVLLNKAHEIYYQLCQDKNILLKPETAYLDAQKYISAHKESAKSYWREKMAEVQDANDLNYLFRTNLDLDEIQLIQSPQSKELCLGDSFYNQLKESAKKSGVTVNVLIQFAWHKLIQIYTRDTQTIVGTTVSGRELPIDGIESSVGLYINTLPLIVNWDVNKAIQEQLKEIHQDIAAMNHHSFMNLSGLKKNTGRLFHSLFVFENYPSVNPDLSGVSAEYQLSPIVKEVIEKLDYPVALIAYEDLGNLYLKMQYAGEILSESQAENLLDQLNLILADLSDLSENLKKTGEISITSSRELTLLDSWNKTERSYESNKTLHELFEAQVEKTPNNIAVVFEDQELTYQELNTRSNQLARKIRKEYLKVTGENLKPDTLIALCLERGPDLLIGLLGVLKAGGAYVPMDPTYPDERIEFILEDTKAALVLVDSQGRIQDSLLHSSLINVGQYEFYSQESSENLDPISGPKDLAYVIYTSGTTGKPKGVLQIHSNVVRLFTATDQEYGFNSHDVWTLFHSYVFDFTVWELWGAFLYGGKLVVPTYHETRDTAVFHRLCKDRGVSVLNQTPAAFYQFIEEAISQENPSENKIETLRYVIFGGDALNMQQLIPWWNLYGEAQPKLINMYGITETTVHVTYKELSRQDLKHFSNIGSAIRDLTIYVLDSNLNPLPIGVVGELYVGGAGLARGYLNRPELTQERFIENPFASDIDKKIGWNRLYKTGDLVRFLPNGNLEYIGRNDFQVKIRGHRIELGEIEHALSKYPPINQSVVFAKDRVDGQKYLAAYYTSETPLNPEDLKIFLSQDLPEYMIPSAYIHMEKFPLTINGKLDRKALPEPEFKTEDGAYEAPRTDLEKQLCQIWQEVLELDSVGIKDNFFNLGGDSIRSIRVIASIKKLGLEASFKDLFDCKTIEKMADKISQAIYIQKGPYEFFSLIENQNLKEQLSANHLLEDAYPASYLQMGMLLESQIRQDGAYHTVFLYTIKNKFHESKARKILSALIQKHELLRAAFIEDESNGYNVLVYKNIDLSEKIIINQTALSNEFLERKIQEERAHNFDLNSPGLYRFYLYSDPNIQDEFHFIFSCHHAIEDGWSVASFVSEFVSQYERNSDSIGSDDRVFELRYGSFIKKERALLANSEVKNFWENYLGDYEINFHELKSKSEKLEQSIDPIACQKSGVVLPEISQKLLSKAHDLNTPVDVLFLAVYALVLLRFFNTEDLVFGVVVNNRLEDFDGEKLFGLFLNTIPMRVKKKIADFLEIDSFIAEIHQGKNNLLEYKAYPYGKIKSDLHLDQDIYQTAFNYVNFHVSDSSYESGSFDSKGGFEKTNIPLMINVSRSKNDFELSFSSDGQSIDQGFLDKIFNYFQYYLKIFSEFKSLDHSLFLLPEEASTVLNHWNKTDGVYPETETMYSMFESQVVRTPENVAVSFEGMSLTYRELNQKANQVARLIRNAYENKTSERFKSGALICISLERSLEMLIGILGILKAGGAYVPVDPSYPDDRIGFILEDTQSPLVLTQSKFVDKLKNINPAIELLALDLGSYLQESDEDLGVQSSPKDLAYVIYTSGTTGKPKGVMIAHQGAVNRIHWMQSEYPLSPSDVILQKTPFSFDVSVWELFWANWYGAKIVFARPEGHKDSAYLQDLIESEKVTVMHFVPSMLSAFTQDLSSREEKLPSSLSYVFCSGEALLAAQVKAFMALENIENHAEKLELHNLYGPTEASIDVTYFPCGKGERAIAIGKPILNMRTYVLDAALNPVPVGVVGELYLGGIGLARGYLNRPELTQERFISNPFMTESDQVRGYTRLYKTGDVVRWLPDGNIEYIGRNDFQVKIRGFRIELGEIESALSNFPGIKQVAVLAREKAGNPNDKYLVAYYVSEHASSTAIENIALQAYLLGLMPDYMVPGVYVRLDQLPLTINGKLDTRSLPDPVFKADESLYVAPRNDLELQICKIWGKLLGVEKVGLADDFFNLGGNSILAIQTAHQMSKTLDQNVPVALFFSQKSIGKILENLSLLEEEIIKIEKINNQNPVLSFGQERLWFIEQYAGGTDAYNIPMCLKFQEGTDVELFKASIQSIIKRHEVLRTIFSRDAAGVDYQCVKQDPLEIAEEFVASSDLEQVLKDQIHVIFDLRKDYPIKIHLFTTETGERLALINVHHIAFDGWSMEVFIQELEAFYAYYAKGQPLQLPDLEIQYKDFAAWQKKRLSGNALQTQLNYWKEKLVGYENLSFPTDRTRPSQIDYAGEYFSFDFGLELSRKLRSLAKEKGVTLYALLLSGFYVLLNKYTGQEDLILGSPISNRHYHQIEHLIGFFVNTLALRVQFKEQENFEGLLEQVSKLLTEAQDYQDVPFERLVDLLGLEKDSSRHPLFQIMFGIQGFSESFSDALFESLPIDSYYKVAKFDLSLMVDDAKESMVGMIAYATSLFNPKTMERLAQHYIYVLEQISAAPNLQISEVKAVLPSELEILLSTWNRTDRLYESDKTLHELFESQVKRTPDNIAVVFENQDITYQDLNEKSNQIARLIRKTYKKKTGQSFQADTLVGLCLDRSLEMIIGILGVLKAGGAYVPIDPSYPEDRIQFILEDTQAELVLTQNVLLDYLARLTQSSELIALDLEIYEQESSQDLEPISSPKDLAYVIYTSGTTGRPKGVMIEHQSVVHLSEEMIRRQSLIGADRCSQYANYVFDASVYEIFPTLLVGASLHIVPMEAQRDPALLVNFIKEKEISKLFLPTAVLKSIDLAKLENTTLRLIHTGGESLNGLTTLPSIPLMNQYGPTEMTVCATECLVSDLSHIHIGRPLANTNAYVLDQDLKPVPIGAVGELYLGGAGLARGYLNQPELTQERFIPNPFMTKSDQGRDYPHVYKTGDLVRWLPDGNLDYIGRNDFQVKIRGFRIELGEIEKALLSHDLIEQAVVVIKTRATTADKYLVAYYVSESPIETSELSNFLARLLPDYMAPGVFAYLESLPLTINGKLDQKALPEPELRDNKESYIGPRNPLEERICEIWSEVLGINAIGIQDDFFNLGGDSILSIQLTSKLHSAGLFCSVKNIFDLRTIENISKHLEENLEKRVINAEQGLLAGEFDLLPIQSWFFENQFENKNHWNQSFLIKVPCLDLGLLKTAIQQLVDHHDVLRSVFRKNSVGKWSQIYQEGIKVPELKILSCPDISIESSQRIMTEWQSDFDIESGPLWQIAYIDGLAEGEARVYCAFHHLIMDAVSWRILISDLQSLYDGKSLGEKTSSYRQFVNKVQEYPNNHKDELKIWSEQLRNQVDYQKKYPPKDSLQSVVKINHQLTKDLLKKANRAYQTEINDLLLSALSHALSQYMGSSNHWITLEGHGREDIGNSTDLSKTIGWFTSIYPVKLSQQEDIGETIQAIKENLRRIPNKGLGYGAFRYCSDQPKLAGQGLPPIAFNYLGQFDGQKNNHRNTAKEHWQISSENSGESIHKSNRSSNLITLNGFVLDGELTFNILSKVDSYFPDHFAQVFESALTLVIKHCVDCVDQGKISVTASDFKAGYEPITIVNPEASGQTLVLVHPGEGGSEAYLNTICPYLSKEIKVILIDHYLLKTDNHLNLSSFKSLATHYISLLKTQNLIGEGKLYLGGYSFGATAAYEMARQLTIEKIEVESLFLLDPIFINLLGQRDYLNSDEVSKKLGTQKLNYRDWHANYEVHPWDGKIHLFKCMIPSSEDKLYEILVSAPYSGLEKVSQNLSLNKVICSHGEMLHEKNPIETAKEINRNILISSEFLHDA